MTVAVRKRGITTAQRRDWVQWLAVAISLVAAIPFVLPGFPAARDSLSHLYRVWAMDAAVRTGDLYPRWFSDFVYGYGYSLFTYYGPLLYWIAEIPRLVGLDSISALKVAMVATIAAAGLGAYLVARDFSGRAGGLIAAAVYVSSPYFQTDLLVRGAFPEALGMAILPYVCWAIGGTGRRWTAILAVSTAALILAHNAAALIGLPIAAGYAAWLGFFRPSQIRHLLLHTITGFALGLVLSAFFWLPAVLQLDDVALGASDTLGMFIQALADPSNLVQPTFIHNYREVEGAFLTAGAVQIGLAVVGFVAGIRRARWMLSYFALVAVVAAVLMMTYSAPFWRAIPLAPLMAFPWRLQMVLAFATAMLASGLPLILWRGRPVIATVAIVLAYLAGFGALRPPVLDLPGSAINGGGFARFERWSGFIGTTSPVQFLPRSVSIEAATLPDPAPLETSGPAPVVTVIEASPTRYLLNTRSAVPSKLRLRVFTIRGWTAEVDKSPVTVQADGPGGIVSVDVPAGDHQVLFDLQETQIERISSGVSLSGVIVLALLLVAPAHRRSWRGPAGAGLLAVLLLAIGFWPRTIVGWNPRTVDLGVFRLLGYSSSVNNGTISILSFWQVGDRGSAHAGWKSLTRLVSEDGRVVAEDVRLPRYGTVSADRWGIGDLVTDSQSLDVPPETPAGTYRLALGWRGPDGRDVITDATSISIPTIESRSIAAPARKDQFAEGIRLVGAQVSPVVTGPLGLSVPWVDLSGRRTATIPAVDVTLVWQSDRPRIDDLSTFVSITNGRTEIAKIDSYPPFDSRFTSSWPVGQPVEQRFRLNLPPSVAPGRYRVDVGLFRRPSLERVSLTDGRTSVSVGEVRQSAPDPVIRSNTKAGPVTLRGFERHDTCSVPVQTPCDLSYRLVWRATEAPKHDLIATVQLHSAEGVLVAQADGPIGGEPTHDWVGNEQVEDLRTVSLPAGLAPGPYTVMLGVYEAGEPNRLLNADGELSQVGVVNVGSP